MPSTNGPIKAPTATSTIISGIRRKRRDELCDRASAEYEPEIPEDVLGFHDLPLLFDEVHEPFGERCPAQVLQAVAPRDLPASTPLLLWQL